MNKVVSQRTKLQQQLDALGDAEYMSDEQLAVFKHHLEQERDRLTRDLSGIASSFKETDCNVPDEADKASAQDEQERCQRELHVKRQHLKQIAQALRAIAEGEYGFCVDCGEDIGLGRLISVPTSCRDVECANRHEIKQSHQIPEVA